MFNSPPFIRKIMGAYCQYISLCLNLYFLSSFNSVGCAFCRPLLPCVARGPKKLGTLLHEIYLKRCITISFVKVIFIQRVNTPFIYVKVIWYRSIIKKVLSCAIITDNVYRFTLVLLSKFCSSSLCNPNPYPSVKL